MKTTQDLMPRVDLTSRDPAGFLFKLEGLYYRAVSVEYLPHLELLESTGFYQKLISKGWILPFKRVPTFPEAPTCAAVLLPEQLSFVSYPAEWSFSQLKEAALLTLDIQQLALHHGMTLKDATPFNIQLHKGRPVLIDSLSFEKYEVGHPWQAYRQFCEQFLAPLLLARHKGADLLAAQSFFTDGVPLATASKLLPLSSWLHPSSLFHVHLHAKASTYSEAKKVDEKKIKLSETSLPALIDGLRSAVSSLVLPGKKSEWSDYYGTCNYTDEALSFKKKTVETWLSALPEKPATAWDLGTNTGEFSKLLMPYQTEVLSIDTDHQCVELLYKEVRKNSHFSIHPLKADISSPTPATGWMNKERSSLLERGRKRDLLMALALIHHIVIGRHADFPSLSELFSKMGRHLIIEYVDKLDPQAQRLLRARRDNYPGYTKELFLSSFSRYFSLVKQQEIPSTQRTLFLFQNHES